MTIWMRSPGWKERSESRSAWKGYTATTVFMREGMGGGGRFGTALPGVVVLEAGDATPDDIAGDARGIVEYVGGCAEDADA